MLIYFALFSALSSSDKSRVALHGAPDALALLRTSCLDEKKREKKINYCGNNSMALQALLRKHCFVENCGCT